MNIEQAIISMELHKQHNPVDRENYDIALTALREKQERKKGCEYCKGYGNPQSEITRLKFNTWGNEMVISQGNFKGEHFKFCPKCGKKLEVDK